MFLKCRCGAAYLGGTLSPTVKTAHHSIFRCLHKQSSCLSLLFFSSLCYSSLIRTRVCEMPRTSPYLVLLQFTFALSSSLVSDRALSMATQSSPSFLLHEGCCCCPLETLIELTFSRRTLSIPGFQAIKHPKICSPHKFSMESNVHTFIQSARSNSSKSSLRLHKQKCRSEIPLT